MVPVEWLAQRVRDFSAVEPSGWMKNELARIRNNSYVRLCGDINLLGKAKPHVSAFFVASIDIPEEIVFHDLQVAHLLVSKLVPDSPTTPATRPLQQPQSSSTLAGASEAAPASASGITFGAPDPPPTGMSFYGDTASRQAAPRSATATTILEVLRNMSKLKPGGLSTEEILSQLVGRGIGVDDAAVSQECMSLARDSAVTRTELGLWRVPT